MKKIKLSLLFVLTCTLIHAQKPSLTFLMNVTKCAEYSCFQDSAQSKHFEYYNSVDDNTGKTVTFQSNKNDATKNNNLSFIIFNAPLNSFVFSNVSITTYDSNYFNSLKQQINSKGFKAGETTTDSNSGGLQTQYNSTQFPKFTIFLKTTNLSKMGYNLVLYSVGIQKLP